VVKGLVRKGVGSADRRVKRKSERKASCIRISIYRARLKSEDGVWKEAIFRCGLRCLFIASQ